MQVIGWIIGILFGAGLALALVWLVRAPFRAGGYVARSVRAHDVRNRETLGLRPSGKAADHPPGILAGEVPDGHPAPLAGHEHGEHRRAGGILRR